MRIAVDAMGGDYAPVEVVKGSIDAAKELGVEIILVGDEARIREELANNNTDNLPISIHHTTEVIEMGESPAVALRKKKNASVVVGTKLVKDGLCDAIVSAGNTGASMGSALLGLGRIKGIHRPAIASIIPTLKGVTLLLDVGANAECDPQNLV